MPQEREQRGQAEPRRWAWRASARRWETCRRRGSTASVVIRQVAATFGTAYSNGDYDIVHLERAI